MFSCCQIELFPATKLNSETAISLPTRLIFTITQSCTHSCHTNVITAIYRCTIAAHSPRPKAQDVTKAIGWRLEFLLPHFWSLTIFFLVTDNISRNEIKELAGYSLPSLWPG